MKKVIYRIFDIFITIWDKVALLSALGLLLILVVTMIDVCIRPFDRSVKGSMELVMALITVVAFFGFGKAVLEDAFIKVEIFKFGKLEFAIKILIEVLHFAIFAFVTYYCFEQSLVGLKMGTSSQLLDIPRWPFQMLSGFAFGMAALCIPLKFYIDAEKRKAVSKDE
jgi:TRAP-type mannitol/chloroaromatic compound transport system permease small subunit